MKNEFKTDWFELKVSVYILSIWGILKIIDLLLIYFKII